jgi:hypothetical protein
MVQALLSIEWPLLVSGAVTQKRDNMKFRAVTNKNRKLDLKGSGL